MIEIFSEPITPPSAVLVTFPAGVLVGKVSLWFALVGLLLAALSFLAASMFWNYGLRHYSGASA